MRRNKFMPFKDIMTLIIVDIEREETKSVMFAERRFFSMRAGVTTSNYCKLIWRGVKYGLLEFRDTSTPDDIIVTVKGRKYAEVEATDDTT